MASVYGVKPYPSASAPSRASQAWPVILPAGEIVALGIPHDRRHSEGEGAPISSPPFREFAMENSTSRFRMNRRAQPPPHRPRNPACRPAFARLDEALAKNTQPDNSETIRLMRLAMFDDVDRLEQSGTEEFRRKQRALPGCARTSWNCAGATTAARVCNWSARGRSGTARRTRKRWWHTSSDGRRIRRCASGSAGIGSARRNASAGCGKFSAWHRSRRRRRTSRRPGQTQSNRVKLSPTPSNPPKPEKPVSSAMGAVRSFLNSDQIDLPGEVGLKPR